MALIPDLVFQTATAMLDCLSDALVDAGVAVPERAYVHQGQVALDCCDQLVVSFAGLVHAVPGGGEEIVQCSPARTAIFDVWLTRCVPTLKQNGDPPTPDELTDSAQQLQIDAYVLAYVLWSTLSEGCWGSGCDSVILGPVVPYGPEGQCGGSHATVTVQLTGLGAVSVPS